MAKDPEALTRFYASLFGWKVKTNNAPAIVLDPAGLSFGLYRPRPQALS